MHAKYSEEEEELGTWNYLLLRTVFSRRLPRLVLLIFTGLRVNTKSNEFIETRDANTKFWSMRVVCNNMSVSTY